MTQNWSIYIDWLTKEDLESKTGKREKNSDGHELLLLDVNTMKRWKHKTMIFLDSSTSKRTEEKRGSKKSKRKSQGAKISLPSKERERERGTKKMMVIKAAAGGMARALSVSATTGRRCSDSLSSWPRPLLLPPALASSNKATSVCCVAVAPSLRRTPPTFEAPPALGGPKNWVSAPRCSASLSAMAGRDKKDERPDSASRLLTVPTILTLGRVAAVPLLVAAFYLDGWWANTMTTGIFLAAAATDWLDGFLARKMKLGSAFGAFLDPVADKLMVAATLVLLCTRPVEVVAFGHVPWLLTVPSIVIIGREITMSAVREWAASQDTSVLEAVAVSNLGKWKTATQMTALTILLAARDSSHSGPSLLATSGVALLYLSSGLALWSLVVYMRGIWKVLLR